MPLHFYLYICCSFVNLSLFIWVFMHHMRWWHTKAENIISHALSAYAAQMAMEKNKSLRKGTGDLLQPSSHTDAGYKVGKI